jgi:hypothetical protein
MSEVSEREQLFVQKFLGIALPPLPGFPLGVLKRYVDISLTKS